MLNCRYSKIMTAHSSSNLDQIPPVEPAPAVLLTGGTGFIGSHLARRLVADGWQVHLLIRSSSNLKLLHAIHDQVHLHMIPGETAELVAMLATIQPVLVYHLASLFIARHTTPDVTPLMLSNIAFPAQLLEAMAVNGVHRLVNTGTAWQHYESNDYHPVSLYAATKQAFEAILQFYFETTPLRSITLKLFDTYGPQDPRPKLFHILRQALRHKGRLDMTPGEQQMDMVHIDDVVDAFIIAGQRLQKSQVKASEEYAVSSGAVLTLRELVERYLGMTRQPVEVVWGARPYRPREVMKTWTGGKPVPGWAPRISLDTGLKQMVEEALRD